MLIIKSQPDTLSLLKGQSLPITIGAQPQNNPNYKIYNIGNSSPVNLNDFIHTIEEVLNKKAIIEYKPMRAGDVVRTYSDISKLQKDYGYEPETNIKKGIENFVVWYNHYNIKK